MSTTIQKLQNFLLSIGIYLAKRQITASLPELLRLVWPKETNLELVRIGSPSQADGGYLLPKDFDGVSRVFSPGVAESVEFEKHFLNLGIPCDLIDGSIQEAPEDHPLIHFQKLWLAAETTKTSICLDDWVAARAEPGEDLILQMDIEGSEYEVLLAVSQEVIDRFRIIVIEMHDLRSVFSRHGLTSFRLAMNKLLKNHIVVHAHPNNCNPPLREKGLIWPDVMEVTLLRKDRVKSIHGDATLPHHLDLDNTSNPSIRLVSPPSLLTQ
jgi:hypothetical protein